MKGMFFTDGLTLPACHFLDPSLGILTLSCPDDGLTVIQNPSPLRPDDGSPLVQKKFISKNHNEIVSSK